MSKKIKILECIRQGQVGGGESHLLSLVDHLDKSRFEPVVLSFTDGPMIGALRKMGIRTHVIHTERPFDVTKWRQVRSLLKDEGIELVHAHGTRAFSNISWAARSLGMPVVYTVHGWSFHADQHPFIRKIRIAGEKYLTSKADVNISVSASNQRTGEQYIPNFRSVVVNNGIDQSRFSPLRAFKDIRRELNIGEDTLLVLFIARFTHQKQPLALIRAFSQVLAGRSSLHLLMVGDGEQKEEALRLVRARGLEKAVSFEPFRQDVPDVLAAADIFVLPSLWEGLPIGLLEAMSMGKAIVATDVDGTREVISHGETGLLVSPGQDAGLQEALERVIDDAALRRKLQANASVVAKEKFNAGSMTRQIENIYKKALHGIRTDR